MKTNRDVTFDIMKGLGIILVVCGHIDTIPFDCAIKRAIYGFHMPLFFLISGYFYKQRHVRESLFRDFHRLLLPLCITLSICSIAYIYTLASDGLVAYCSRIFNLWTLTYGGPVWFLMALFVCKNVYNYLYIHNRNIIITFCLCLLVSIVVYVIDVQTFRGGYLLRIQQGLIALPYFAMGNFAKKFNCKKPMVVFSLAFIYTVYIYITDSSVVMMSSRYNMFPVEILVGCGGSIIVYYASDFIKYTSFSKILSRIGQMSLLVLCIHAVEMNCGIRTFSDNITGQILILLISSIPVAFMLMKVTIVRKIFV